jgi:hypothetical protein
MSASAFRIDWMQGQARTSSLGETALVLLMLRHDDVNPAANSVHHWRLTWA